MWPRNHFAILGAESAGPQAGRQAGSSHPRMVVLERNQKIILSNLCLTQRRNPRKEEVRKWQVVQLNRAIPSCPKPMARVFPLQFKEPQRPDQAGRGQANTHTHTDMQHPGPYGKSSSLRPAPYASLTSLCRVFFFLPSYFLLAFKWKA